MILFAVHNAAYEADSETWKQRSQKNGKFIYIQHFHDIVQLYCDDKYDIRIAASEAAPEPREKRSQKSGKFIYIQHFMIVLVS